MIRGIKRGISHLEKVLTSLNVNVKAPVEPKTDQVEEEQERIPFDMSSVKLTHSKPSEINSEYFANLPNHNVRLPPGLAELDKEWNTASQFIDDYNTRVKEYMREINTIPEQEGIFHEKSNEGTELDISTSEILKHARNFEDGREKIMPEEEKALYNSPLLTREIDESEYKVYPGSPKGPEIEDDPEAWAKWYLENQPKRITDFLGRDWKPTDSDPDIALSRQIAKPRSGYMNPVDFYLTTELRPEYYAKNQPEYEFVEDMPEIGNLGVHTALEDPEELPYIPPTLPYTVIEYNDALENWNLFRLLPIVFKDMKTQDTELDGLPDSESTPQPEVEIPSVLNYYEMLPNYYKQHRLVQSATLCLERFKPDMSRLDKELFLNRLCNLLTPRDTERYRFLQEYYGKKVSKDQDNLINKEVEEEEEEEEEDDPEAELIKMLSEEGKDGEKEFTINEIPDYGIDWFKREHENPDGLIPSYVNYYDNDDGYWDSYIKYKREKRGMPHMTKRVYFKH